MSDTRDLLAAMTERLLSQHFDDEAMRRARAGDWLEGAWASAVEQGLPFALVQGEQGFGIPLDEGLALVRVIGRHAIPLPITETMIGNTLLAQAGLPLADGVLALVPQSADVAVEQRGSSWHVTGETDGVAWGRNAAALLIESDGRIALMSSGFRLLEEGSNLAQMPRDRLAIDGPAEVAPLNGLSVLEAGALVRALMMAGALETLVALTVTHVTERAQFGRPLSKFQVVQHALAQLASEAAAASAAADLAADAFASASPQTSLAIAAARSRIAEAAGIAVQISHQLHGAIGFTEEHRLHWFTTALWSWRDEFGSASWWTRQLGAAALASSRSSYWPLVASV